PRRPNLGDWRRVQCPSPNGPLSLTERTSRRAVRLREGQRFQWVSQVARQWIQQAFFRLAWPSEKHAVGVLGRSEAHRACSCYNTSVPILLPASKDATIIRTELIDQEAAEAVTVGPNPSIRFLRIERFRGIEKLEWRPAPGQNIIIGPGDSCKSTILEAIGALFSPAPNMNISEFDYFRRDIDKGFEIEAVLAVGDGAILKNDRFPLPPLRGWQDGQLTDLPDEGGAEAVMVCRLTGTADQ